MIDVVYEIALRNIDDFTVHRYGQPLLQGRRPLAPDGVVCMTLLADVPFVSA